MGSGVGFTDSYIKLINPALLNIPLLVPVVLVGVRRASLSPSRVPFVQTFITPTRGALSIHPYPNIAMLDWYKRKRFRRKAAPGIINAVAILFMLLMMGMQTVSAQTFVVKGTVLSATDNTPLPGVNIVEVGTLNGTATDIDGTYTLAVTTPNSSIAASFIGFVTQTIAVAGQTDIIINLEEDINLLEEVVVTAGGIERKERALGFSITQVSGEDLRQSRENNVVNALAGKVAGVLVSKPATGPAGSSRVIIRGASSLGEDSQPLYVDDGVPIDNTTLGSAGMWGGSDGGDGISGINPDDIDNISVSRGRRRQRSTAPAPRTA